eukprot:TRINITY_DN14220_c0_g1_i1.p1 TRINITY_DN14220_c0_g1~~TRINITY_DN14220_c0_g1_i1.p1  ORF type:complete len:706 (-),score=62.31 TRINITY_DN14220_c0_g1_i1:293-2410(-)
MRRQPYSPTNFSDVNSNVHFFIGYTDEHHIVTMTRTMCIVLFIVFLGYASVRLQLIRPKAGNTVAFDIFVTKITMPLVMIKLVLDLRASEVNWMIVLANTLAKTVASLIIWLLTFFAYQTDRSFAKRFITASIFAATTTTTGDMSVGLPMLQAAFGREFNGHVDTSTPLLNYIVVNALVQVFLFYPLSMALVRIGRTLRDNEQACDSDDAKSAKDIIVLLLKELLSFNPTLIVAGTVFAIKHAMEWDDTHISFPQPFRSFIDAMTSAYIVPILFLTGMSLEQAKLTAWSLVMVFTKIGVCAIAGRYFCLYFTSQTPALNEVSFFYGVLPTSLPAIILANKHDPRSTPVVASTLLLGLVFAVPFLYSSAFVVSESFVQTNTYVQVLYFGVDTLGVVCASCVIAAIVCLRSAWGFTCNIKQLLACYAFTLWMYCIFGILINPKLNGTPCRKLLSHNYYENPLMLLYALFQYASYIIVLLLQYFLLTRNSESNTLGSPCKDILWIVACFALAAGAAALCLPQGYDQLCFGNAPYPYAMYFDIGLTSLRCSASSTLSLLMVLGYGTSARQSEGPSTMGGRSVLFSVKTDPSNWASRVPRFVIECIAGLNFAAALIRLGFAIAVAAGRDETLSTKGSFRAMRCASVLVDHGQPVCLLIALFQDADFFVAVRKALLELLGVRSEKNQKNDSKSSDDEVSEPDDFAQRVDAT